MRFKDVFSIIGPGMIGPSSSHTAGVVNIGRAAAQLFGRQPERAEILFFGSLAATYRGHGSDIAVIAGLLQLHTDDERIPDSPAIAEAAGMQVSIRTSGVPAVHPNTLAVTLRRGRRRFSLTGCSIGGGNIEIISVNGFDLKMTGRYPTLIIYHDDRPGLLADITGLLGDAEVNIGYMDVDRKDRLGEAATAIEADGAIPAQLLARIKRIPNVKEVSYMDLNDGGGDPR